MRNPLRLAVFLITACTLLRTPSAWAKCETCCCGESMPDPVYNSLVVVAGIDFAGSEYAQTCLLGFSGCTVHAPSRRFWQQDLFAVANSGTSNDNPPYYGMLNPAIDFGLRPDRTSWTLYQGGWYSDGVVGCIRDQGNPRTVVEVSFCDASGAAFYAVESVKRTAYGYDFDYIQGAGGDGNLLPLTRVPVPIAVDARPDQPVTGFTTITVDLHDPLVWFTENGRNDPGNVLIAGYELLYQNSATDPGAGCSTDLAGWTPVRSPAHPADPLGPVPPGSAIWATVPTAGAGEQTYLSARIVYRDPTALVVSPLGGSVVAASGGSLNAPPIAVAGGPYRTDCDGGITGLWMDGSASFDPDPADTLRYQWTTTCSGVIDAPNAVTSTANFDCDPCKVLACSVTLRVTDSRSAWSEATVPVLSTVSPHCFAVGNDLQVVGSGGGVDLSWWGAGSAPSYLLLSDDDKTLGGPTRVDCGSVWQVRDERPLSAGIRFYRLSATDTSCTPR